MSLTTYQAVISECFHLLLQNKMGPKEACKQFIAFGVTSCEFNLQVPLKVSVKEVHFYDHQGHAIHINFTLNDMTFSQFLRQHEEAGIVTLKINFASSQITLINQQGQQFKENWEL